MPIKNQFQRIIKKNQAFLFKNNDKSGSINKLKDITDGQIYQTLLNDRKLSKNSFTFLLNTDGIALCEKSKLGIWPVIFVINELPVQIRFCIQNVIIAGTFWK
jgi:hypothetical protein